MLPLNPGSSRVGLSAMIHPGSKMLIWIDLDNSPHAQFFPPIIRRLEEAGYSVLLTARRFGQVEEIAQAHGLGYTVIGQHRTPHFFLTRASATVRVPCGWRPLRSETGQPSR